MSLNIVLGKPKTGKSSYIYEKIKEDINNKKDVILFVPSQLRQETENKYMEVLKEDGIIGVNITTISITHGVNYTCRCSIKSKK